MLKADGEGGVSGHGTFRSADIACDVQFSGTYTINETGMGNITATTTTTTAGCVAGVLDFNLVLANNGQIINVASSENDYMCGTLTRQSKGKFSNSTLSGKFALSLQGPSSIVSASEPYTAGVVLIESDGKGNVSGSGAFRSYGVSCTGTLAGGSMVTEDGTGTINMNFTASSPWCSSVVVDLSLALLNENSGLIANAQNDLMSGTINRQIYK